MNKPTFHNVQQGTAEWLALKARFPYSASNAAAMLGVSPYKSRAQLLREIATAGESTIFEPVADEGHRTEALARPIAEGVIGASLFAVVASREVGDLTLLASCDGLTMRGDQAWEHKQANETDAAEVDSGSVPAKHQPQCEQVLLVTGADRLLFSIGDGTEDGEVSCWYESQPDLRTALIAGWQLLDRDVAEYRHVEVMPDAIGETPEALPPLVLDITGSVRDTNLATWQAVVSERIKAINTDLQTDQDFADAEKTVKFLKHAEDELKAALARAYTGEVYDTTKTIESLMGQMREKRLELNRTVEAEKQNRRAEIIDDAVRALQQHAIEIAEAFDSRVHAPDVPATFRNDVAAGMKGRKTVQSLKDAAAQVVTDGKLAMNAAADIVRTNLKEFDEQNKAVDFSHLFTDLNQLVRKPSDDFRATLKARIADDNERRNRAREAAEGAVTQQAVAEPATQAQESVAQTDSPSDPNEPPTLSLGDLSSRLGFAVRADFLESLGFAATKEKRSMLYRESDWPLICDAIVAHVRKVRDQAARKAA